MEATLTESPSEMFSEADIAKLTSQLQFAFAEAAGEYDGDWRQVGGFRTPATYSGGHQSILSNWSSLDDRIDGRFRPFYQHEHDLRAIRAKSRNLATFTSIAVGANTALQVYTVGGEWQYEATGRENIQGREGVKADPMLLAAAQRVIDDVIEQNEFQGTLDESIHNTARTDGESLVAVYGGPGGKVKLREIDADSLREPQATNAKRIERGLQSLGYSGVGEQSWTFGVHTSYSPTMKRVDHSEPIGYHVVFDERGKNWDYLPSFPQSNAGPLSGKALIHLKLNVPLDAKRGVSDYYPIQEVLERKHILGRNLAVGAAIQAAIAYIRHHKGPVTRDGVMAQISAALDVASKQATANRNDGKSQQNLNAGTVIDLKDSEYHAGPLGELKSAVFIEVCAYLMRCIGIRWLMPEYMISGDASNANFSSTLVSESPFVRAREADQRKFTGHFKRIMWAALKIAFDCGVFSRWCPTWQDFRAIVELRIKAPPVASRNKADLLAECMALYDKQLISANDVLTDLNRETRPGFDDKYADPPPAPVIGGGMNGPDSSVDAARNAAVAAALESVGTSDEAKAVLNLLVESDDNSSARVG